MSQQIKCHIYSKMLLFIYLVSFPTIFFTLTESGFSFLGSAYDAHQCVIASEHRDKRQQQQIMVRTMYLHFI